MMDLQYLQWFALKDDKQMEFLLFSDMGYSLEGKAENNGVCDWVIWWKSAPQINFHLCFLFNSEDV